MKLLRSDVHNCQETQALGQHLGCSWAGGPGSRGASAATDRVQSPSNPAGSDVGESLCFLGRQVPHWKAEIIIPVSLCRWEN